MSFVFRCPRCATPIADVPGPGAVEATCSRCRAGYRVVTGTVEVGASRAVAKAETGTTEREYDLRIRTSPAATEVVSFRRPMREAPIVLAPGDLVSVARRIGGFPRDAPVALINHTGRQSHELAPAFAEWIPAPGATAGIAAAVFLLLAIAGAPGGALVAVLIAGLVALTASVAARGAPTGEQRLTPARVRELRRFEGLLEQKLRLAARRDEVRDEHARRETLAERLRALRAKMDAVGVDAYRTRIETVDTGLRVLEQQLDTERRLLAQYERTLTLLEIEVETGALLEGVAEGPAEAVILALEELEALRSAHEELEHRLAANEEVERMLRAPG